MGNFLFYFLNFLARKGPSVFVKFFWPVRPFVRHFAWRLGSSIYRDMRMVLDRTEGTLAFSTEGSRHGHLYEFSGMAINDLTLMLGKRTCYFMHAAEGRASKRISLNPAERMALASAAIRFINVAPSHAILAK